MDGYHTIVACAAISGKKLSKALTKSVKIKYVCVLRSQNGIGHKIT